jgi:UDP-2-acetamido-2-deoxy-ribo-hexuluronate aminotransferase
MAMAHSMKKIQMVDTVGQYQRIKKEVDEAVLRVIGAGTFIGGPEVQAFQKELGEYLGVKSVIACGNGTDALQIAMMALGLQPGDEVITASFTYVATAEVIALLRLKPVLVEVNPETFTIDPSAIEKAITKRTKAIVPVHLYGQCADMDPIMAIAEKYGLFVIEDAAQAIGSWYSSSDGKRYRAGTMGTIGCTSFYPSKNLGAYGDGGAMYTNDETLGKRLKMIANHGQSVQYVHDEVGVNSRLDAVQAAVLRIKLRHLDEYEKARNEVAAYYDKAFAGHAKIRVPARAKKSTHVFHQYTLTLNGVNRDELRAHLSAKEIPTMVYYPKPLHQQKAYRDPAFRDEDFRNTIGLCSSVISLPVHTEMDVEMLEYISNAVLEFVT